VGDESGKRSRKRCCGYKSAPPPSCGPLKLIDAVVIRRDDRRNSVVNSAMRCDSLLDPVPHIGRRLDVVGRDSKRTKAAAPLFNGAPRRLAPGKAALKARSLGWIERAEHIFRGEHVEIVTHRCVSRHVFKAASPR
jgi:hypothetical protein